MSKETLPFIDAHDCARVNRSWLSGAPVEKATVEAEGAAVTLVSTRPRQFLVSRTPALTPEQQAVVRAIRSRGGTPGQFPNNDMWQKRIYEAEKDKRSLVPALQRAGMLSLEACMQERELDFDRQVEGLNDLITPDTKLWVPFELPDTEAELAADGYLVARLSGLYTIPDDPASIHPIVRGVSGELSRIPAQRYVPYPYVEQA